MCRRYINNRSKSILIIIKFINIISIISIIKLIVMLNIYIEDIIIIEVSLY